MLRIVNLLKHLNGNNVTHVPSKLESTNLKDCKSLKTLEWKKCNSCTEKKKVELKCISRIVNLLKHLNEKNATHVPSKLESKRILRIVNLKEKYIIINSFIYLT